MELYIDNTLLLKPIPPEIKTCPTCKLIFLSFLRMDAKQFITCDDCRIKARIKGKAQNVSKKQFN